jgi:hypothetical protein
MRGERNRGYRLVKRVARSGEDHDTQSTAAVQTIDIRAAEAAHSYRLSAFRASKALVDYCGAD